MGRTDYLKRDDIPAAHNENDHTDQGYHGGLCGMPACGHAVGCGVRDTPELWCGAAGLCARVRACAGAAESLQTYIHNENGNNFVFHRRFIIQSGHEHTRTGH